MKIKYLFIILGLILVWPVMSQASFYRTDSTDTAYKYGSGIDGVGHKTQGWGYNIKLLIDYGYAEADAKPILGSVSNISKNSARLNWSTSFIGQSMVTYGLQQSSTDDSSWLEWSDKEQRYVLSNLNCGKTYWYKISVKDIVNNIYQTDWQQFKTLSCNVNILENEEFDIFSNTGILELTSEISGKASVMFADENKLNLGILVGGVRDHSQITINTQPNTKPAKPYITSSVYAINNNIAQISITRLIDNSKIASFSKKATLEMHFSSKDNIIFAKNDLKIAYYSEAKKQWLVLPSIVDLDKQTVRADILYAGYYRLVVSTVNPDDVKLMSDQVYKEQGTNTLYYIDNGIKHEVPNYYILDSWGFKPGRQTDSNQIFKLPLGDDLLFRSGSIVKVGTSTYYYIINGQKRLFMSSDVFNRLGYDDQYAYQVTTDYLSNYPDGEAIVSTLTKLDATLVKYADSSKVYYIENGKKRWIIDENTFNRNRFNWDKIITIPTIEIYPDGDLII